MTLNPGESSWQSLFPQPSPQIWAKITVSRYSSLIYIMTPHPPGLEEDKVAEASRLIRPFVIEAGSKLERSHDKIVQLWYIQSFSNPPGPKKGGNGRSES
jgi:hypothetical protein